MITNAIFSHKSPSAEKLIKFGFSRVEGGFECERKILGGDFTVRVSVSADGEVKAETFDSSSGEPYALHLVEGSEGEFIGRVREQFKALLEEISEKCFYRDSFKSPLAKELIKFVEEKYFAETEYLWEKFPQTAVWRRNDSKKWFGVVFRLPKKKLGLQDDELVEFIDLRLSPDRLNGLIDEKRFFRAYHMNKKSWFTVLLDGSADFSEICRLVDDSYHLATK